MGVCVCVCASVLSAQPGSSRTKNRSQIIDWHNVSKILLNQYYCCYNWVTFFLHTRIAAKGFKRCHLSEVFPLTTTCSVFRQKSVCVQTRLRAKVSATKHTSCGRKVIFFVQKSCVNGVSVLVKASLCEQIGLSVCKSISL